jgi:spoIIIJ-associated protein
VTEPADAVVEATGETVGEAKWAALRELERRHPGIEKSAVRFEVLSEGERGLLGVGFEPARVIAFAPAAVVAAALEVAGDVIESGAREDESAAATDARELLERIVTAVGVRARVRSEEDDEHVLLTVEGGELGLLIGRHGQMIDAVQYLLNAIAFRAHGSERKEVVVDAAGYRERRRRQLESLAVRTAERVLHDHEPVELEPMGATERKVVHLRLKAYDGVETSSEGAEPHRYVVVRPAR